MRTSASPQLCLEGCPDLLSLPGNHFLIICSLIEVKSWHHSDCFACILLLLIYGTEMVSLPFFSQCSNVTQLVRSRALISSWLCDPTKLMAPSRQAALSLVPDNPVHSPGEHSGHLREASPTPPAELIHLLPSYPSWCVGLERPRKALWQAFIFLGKRSLLAPLGLADTALELRGGSLNAG